MRNIILAILFVLPLTMSANDRSLDEMKRIALNVLTGDVARSKGRISNPQLSCNVNGRSYAVFTASDNGFVIVSKNDEAEPVLGYSYNSSADGQMPDALKFFLDCYDKATSEQQAAMSQSVSRSVSAVEPFVTTKWGQDKPYNILTPSTTRKKNPTGCVATVMAQVINYMQYPSSAKFRGSYTLNNDNVVKYEDVNSTYSFPYKDVYDETCTAEEDTAVAVLMRDCGYAVEMGYDPSGSGAFPHYAARAYVSKFAYPKAAIKILNRGFYTKAEWDDIIFGELAKKYPVHLGGNDSKGENGHAFIACGSDAEGKVYINWGWEGQYNAYYSMDLLNPQNYDFSYGLTAVFGFHPQALDTDIEQLTFNSPTSYSFEFSAGTTYSLTAKFPEALFNYGPFDKTVSVVLVGEDKKTGEQKILTTLASSVSVPSYQGFADLTKPIRKLPAAGEYRAWLAVCDASGSTLGSPVPVRVTGGMIYYDLTIDNKSMTFSSTPSPLPTSISNVVVSENKKAFSGRTYNISGQQVNNTYKGIVIENGKKVIRR